MHLTYDARAELPARADIDRIIDEVIANVKHAQDVCPELAVTPGVKANHMAREIKRRLNQLIRVEVDLIVTGTTDSTPPAPLAAAPGGRSERTPAVAGKPTHSCGPHSHALPLTADGCSPQPATTLHARTPHDPFIEMCHRYGVGIP
ncbi:hypothetical protein [Nissabacter sp. SGAir0207]|uniref:hypothetical protein n=1 Tax=Nissabacter sp. SGAir0207 TaxID=2126321 RepID=UPI0010CCBA83|nr:hypothetical protein [Nissabacter sp. SGAir0207]QCR38956.1 hypothetical protein C1N62_22855 [Nissabacter sp. SGAir0207]